MGGFVPDETVREVLQRTDLVRLVGETVPLRKAGARFVGLCPFHAEKTPSFSVNAEQGFYYCFGCHAGGDAISFLRELHGLNFREALEQLAARAGIILPEAEAAVDERTARARAQERSERARILEANALAQAFFRVTYGQDAGAAAREYVARRELTNETVERFGLGAAPAGWDGLLLHLRRNGVPADVIERSGLVSRRDGGGTYDRFRARLTFPVLDVAGKVLGFSARVLDVPAGAARQPHGNADTGPKYVNSPESPVFQKGHTLFGLYQARRALRAARRAVIVEGNVDVVMLAQAGIENVVAPMGTALTEAHVLQLKRFVDDVDLVFDGDDAGRAAARKALELALKSGLGGRIVLLPQGEDPDSLVRKGGPDALAQLTRRAPALSEFFVTAALSLYDGSVPSKTRVIEAVKPLFGWLTSDVERDEYERRVEQQLGLGPGTLRRYVDLPEATVRLGVPEDTTRGTRLRTSSKAELTLLELLLSYPALIPRFRADDGISLLRGERRRWLAERCLTHYDEWKGTWHDTWAFLSEIEDLRVRDFVARALNEEPTTQPAESDQAYTECIRTLREFDMRERKLAVNAQLPRSGWGPEAVDLLREKLRLRDGDAQGTGGTSPSSADPDVGRPQGT
jgi:DNA primase